VIFVPEWPKGEFVSILTSFCVWTKSLLCKDVVKRDSTCQSIFRKLCTAKKIEDFRFPVSRPDDVSSRLDAHLSTIPSFRTTCSSRPDAKQTSVWTTYLFRPDPTLYREASVPACTRPAFAASCPDAYQYSNSLRFFPSSNKGKIDQPSGRCGIPSGRTSP
jgi:hypothetical protein